MRLKIAINGYGRIGRNSLRALFESKYRSQIEIVAINDLGDPQSLAHLTQYDSTHGRLTQQVHVENNCLIIDDQKIRVFSERSPAQLPWGDLGVDIVFECTGLFTSLEKASAHITAGAKKVLISAPAGSDVPTIVYGVNHQTLQAQHRIVSNASCTTNCLAPVLKPLQDAFGIERGLMTTIHAYTNDQTLSDVYHSDLRRARSATQSMIPTKTGAASAVGLVIPELKGKLDGLAVRVPILNVSMLDLTLHMARKTSVSAINQCVEAAAMGALKGILAINHEPLVSIDFNHHPASAIVDATQTMVIDNMVKVLAWYDNEWGFSNRMLDTALAMAAVGYKG
ncbi:MAG: type I glyceraldehyde-3-phosphate dehydrogenase [Gammaproteobacteria bacterium]|nr:type I glyceraldehyde-3-phosphate dehydrogenase [Gammaproteobacteria bacterium]